MLDRNATCVRTNLLQVGAIIAIAYMLVMLSLHLSKVTDSMRAYFVGAVFLGIAHCTSTGLTHSIGPIVLGVLGLP
jgi:hypothetical protein